MSEDTKTLIVILLLIFVYPIGLIMMFVWMKWPWWVKLLVALPVTLVVFAMVSIMGVAILATINPSGQVNKARDAVNKNNAAEVLNAVERYYAKKNMMPWGANSKDGYSSSNIKNEAWLGKLISEDELKPSFMTKLEGTTLRLVKTKGSEDIKVCFDSTINKAQEICVPEQK